MKILFLGDVVGEPGRRAVAEALPQWRTLHEPDLVIANAENSAHGLGASPQALDQLQKAGVDAFTMGDHYADADFGKVADYPLVRPLNAPDAKLGTGSRVIETALHRKVLLINLLGHAFIKDPGNNYFDAVDDALEEQAAASIDACVVDFHAEATSEKTALGHYLDGRVSAVVGTHTHIPTADTRILPGGTAYQSDLGMAGALNSAIGAPFESVEPWLRSEMGETGPKAQRTMRQGPAQTPPLICDAVLVTTTSRHAADSIIRLSTRPM